MKHTPHDMLRKGWRAAKGKLVPAARRGATAITTDTTLRLARFFGTSAEVWMNLQALYDLESAKDRLEEYVEREVTPYLSLRQTAVA